MPYRCTVNALQSIDQKADFSVFPEKQPTLFHNWFSEPRYDPIEV